MVQSQLDFGDPELKVRVETFILEQLVVSGQPSAWELLARIESHAGWAARWVTESVLGSLTESRSLTHASREYTRSLLSSGDLAEALRGKGAPKHQVESSIDSLLRESVAYHGSKEFEDMVAFMGNFREYAAYNNMLVRVQNPTCSFYATRSDWTRRFKRRLKEDARPMLILAPMHPVMLVYDIDQTEGAQLPEELGKFAQFEGEWKPKCLDRTLENAKTHDKIRIEFKNLSSTNAGFATITRGDAHFKMRIAVHDQLKEASRYGVICHELAHIYLGHLGTDEDHWWPSRMDLNTQTMEIEAEAVAFIVSSRAGLTGSSAAYVSRYLQDGKIPAAVSLDLIAKAAGRIEDMGSRKLKPRRVKGKDKKSAPPGQ